MGRPLQSAGGMNTTIPFFLRNFQKTPGHGLWRPAICDLLLRPLSPLDFLYEVRELGLVLDTDEGDGEREWEALQRRGGLWIWPGHPKYPESLLASMDPPLLLSVLGSVDVLNRPGIAVVGSREPGFESMNWMECDFSEFLRRASPVVISGGARGVDQKAHSLALRTITPTVAFLPSGLLAPYPKSMEAWYDDFVQGGGAVVSEYAAWTPMSKRHFHHRNRLIAGLSRMVLVVEARQGSGTLITATRAAEIGRPLLTLPGSVWDPRFSGNLELLSQNATMVVGAQDLLNFWNAEVSQI